MRQPVSRKILVILGLALVSWSAIVRSNDVDLKIDVEGFIQPKPTWRNCENQIIESILFVFDGISDDSSRHKNVDSTGQCAKLVDAGKQLLVGVELKRPQNCFIGETPVDDHHVHFLHNLHVHPVDAQINLLQYREHAFKLRFSADGKYGGLSGTVHCDNPGMLRYTYD